MSERKRILWLVSWYPNKYDPFDGDFIQRHAQAAAIYNDIHVLFIKAFHQQPKREEEKKEQPGLTEQIIYLQKGAGIVGKIQSLFSWQKEYKAELAAIINHFRPQVIHVHIPWKVGLIALWTKKKYKLPFVVTEHWGIYNQVVEDNISTKHFFFRYLLKKIYAKASAFISVSTYLGERVNQTLLKKTFTVVPNVVDTALFTLGGNKKERFTFLHVSNMVPLKNVEGILSAFQRFLAKSGIDAQLLMIGNKDNQYIKLAADLQLLNQSVFFKGEVPYWEVAEEMKASHVLVLNSNIENSPCVVGEALCCGLNVITTNVGGIPELVKDSNALLIEPNNNEALENAFLQAFEGYKKENTSQTIVAAQTRFSPATVGRQMDEIYSKVVAGGNR